MDLREASAASSVCWNARKEVKIAGTLVWGSMIPTATASIESSHSIAAYKMSDKVADVTSEKEVSPFVPNP
jgi:hypothetical protein